MKNNEFAERVLKSIGKGKMGKKGNTVNKTELLSENTLATVFNESAIPAMKIKTHFKFFRFFLIIRG